MPKRNAQQKLALLERLLEEGKITKADYVRQSNLVFENRYQGGLINGESADSLLFQNGKSIPWTDMIENSQVLHNSENKPCLVCKGCGKEIVYKHPQKQGIIIALQGRRTRTQMGEEHIFNFGGRCRNCRYVHYLSPEAVATILGMDAFDFAVEMITLVTPLAGTSGKTDLNETSLNFDRLNDFFHRMDGLPVFRGDSWAGRICPDGWQEIFQNC